MKHIRSLFDLTLDEFQEIIALAGDLKQQLRAGNSIEHLKNRTLAMIFEKASLRTRVSFEAGMAQLGGTALYLTSDVGWRERESIADFVRVLAEYCDFVVCRAISQSTVEELASHNVIPVINGLTDQAHPCQALADYMTLRETIPDIEGKQITFVGDGNNVARSLLNVCSMGRIRFRLVGPKEYHIHSSYVEKVKEHAGWLDFEQGTEIDRFVKEADFLYTDVWTSMGQEAEAAVRTAAFRPYQINKQLMSKAPSHCKVLHCLPARRGQEISDEVIDSESSLVFPQAGNRMHVQKGLLVWLARKNGMIA
jgi:ornithine carbamoyltransferase